MMNTFALYQEEVFHTLQSFGEPECVAGARNDKKSQLEFLAIRVPLLRKAVHDGFSFYNLTPDNILGIWDNIWHTSPYFEMMSAALLYYELQGQNVAAEIWPCLVTWSKRVENWAHCDSLANIYSYLLPGQTEKVSAQLWAWSLTDAQWLRRLSLVSLIHYTGKKAVFLTPEQVLPLVTNCITDERYYVQKAVGWVLREMGNVYHAEIRDYIAGHCEEIPRLALTTALTHYPLKEREALVQQQKSHYQKRICPASSLRVEEHHQ